MCSFFSSSLKDDRVEYLSHDLLISLFIVTDKTWFIRE
jgi:hypothetical protein